MKVDETGKGGDFYRDHSSEDEWHFKKALVGATLHSLPWAPQFCACTEDQRYNSDPNAHH